MFSHEHFSAMFALTAMNSKINYKETEMKTNTSNAEPFFVDVMTKTQKWQFRSLVAIWFVALVWFWSWWLRSEHLLSWWGMFLTSINLAWTTVLPGYFFYFVGRMKIANPQLMPPQGKYAMVVTKAPSEPWPVLAKTLTAMLEQDFPQEYDVWLATEKLDDEIAEWCAAHNVHISCRDGVASYQQPVFPHKARCKEGNLSFFYEVAGGNAYDFVMQLDADHVPDRYYLLEMARPFADPTVGYVAAPSVCDANLDESWVVRARLYAEASMHGALQAGYCYDWSPMPIGSHYAVRVEALKMLTHVRNGEVVAVGTLGPELAEDHTTGLAMQSAGWRGAFALNAVASGDGAGSFADSMTQEFQWARSLANVLLVWTKGYWSGLRTRLKFEYGFAQLWYPLYAVFMFLGFVFPVIALITGEPWVDVNLPEFIARSSVLTAACIAVVRYIRNQGWFRPANSPIISWELVLFQFVRWPWVMYAIIQSVVGVLLGKEFAFKVTPKGWKGAKPLPLMVLLPYIVIILVQAGTAILVGNPGNAAGYYYFCILNALSYLIVLTSIIYLHVRENWKHLEIPVVKYVGRPMAYAASAALVVMVAFVMRYEAVVHTLVPETMVDYVAHNFSDPIAALNTIMLLIMG